MSSLLTDLRTKYNTFSKIQKRIADFILQDPERTTLLSITDLAKNCSTSETTVMRLLKKLDYDSYQIFRINLAKELSERPSETINDELSSTDNIDMIKKKVIGHTITAIRDMSTLLREDILKQAVQMIMEANRILFFGVGASSSIAMDGMHKFGNIGLNVCSHPDPHLMNILCANTSKNDLLVAISHTGESNEVLSAVRIAKEHGAQILGLTSFSSSTLASLSDLYLLSSTNDKKYHSEAMASRIVQLTIIDILYIALFLQDEEHYYEALTQSRIAVSHNKR